ncbi:MAG: hypothetical protein HY824_05785 [Acidobacteria bacterium]|nr:hypothetical protein [Acidobacteriota bacterium]
MKVLVSPSAADRLACARDAVRGCAAGSPILLIGATRGAADDLAREVAAAVPATFGVQRLSLTQLAARTALAALADQGVTPGTRLGAEAVAARAVFDATRDAALGYFAPVASTPGFPRALARTLHELRLAGIDAQRLSPFAPAGSDLAWLLEHVEQGFAAAASVDRAELFRTAARVLRQDVAGTRPTYELVVLLDVPIEDAAERELVEALRLSAASVVATVPQGDHDTIDHLAGMGAAVEIRAGTGTGDLACLRRFLFNIAEEPQERSLDGSLELFSAPGEGRECVEMARRLLTEARRGVRFDEMAILVRSPASYYGLLEHALGRAGVPAWFDRGTRRPHPAGRAFLALLACAAEQLSAARFAEYLSLGQVPATGGSASLMDGGSAAPDGAPPRDPPSVPSSDEVFGLPPEADASGDDEEPLEPGGDGAIVGGTLRAPWRWEKLLVEAAVIGRDAARWARRLAGKAAELRLQIDEASRQDGADSGRVLGLRRTEEQLQHLQSFALPIIEELAGWPTTATWGVWLDAFSRLVPRVLRTPAHVLRVLADLRPRAGVGPIDLDEARRVLSDRLLTLESGPAARRFGGVFVGTPQQARGRSFRVVFVPGLAERMFPQKPREDPLLLDELRATAAPGLRRQPHRLASERLLLQLAAGAASERLYVSYPRMELTESRARVPSFYALDVIRAATGRIPDYEFLEERARQAGNAMLA